MKTYQPFAFCIFLSLFIVIYPMSSRASHAAGGDLTYTHISGNNYLIHFNYYRDCIGIPAPTSVIINMQSVSCGIGLPTPLQFIANQVAGTGQEISLPCSSANSTCTGGTLPGMQKYEYETTVTIGGQCPDWRIWIYDCCRNTAITTLQNPGTPGFYIEARLNNVLSDNSSPQFTNDPILFSCIGQELNFNNGMVDQEGDSLVFSLIAPREDANVNVIYIPPYTALQPLTSTGPVIFDSYTGDLRITPSAIEVAVIVMQVQEYRNGLLIGSVMRDIMFYTVVCANSKPSMTGINGTTQQSIPVAPDSTLCFTVFCDDADAGNQLTLIWNESIPDAVFYSSAGAHPAGTFCWTPDSSDLRSQPYVVTVTARDDNCPENASDMYSYFIYVTNDSTYIDMDTYHPLTYNPIRSISGKVYWDVNGNGFRDSLETGFTNKLINMQPENMSMMSDVGGNYYLSAYVPGSHSVMAIPPNGWEISSTPAVHSFNDTLDHPNLDFGFHILTEFFEIDASLFLPFPRCNSNQVYIIDYENTGTMVADGRVKLVIDSAVGFVSSSPAPDQVSGDTLMYEFSNLPLFSINQIEVTLQLPPVAGATLLFYCSVEYDSAGTYYLNDEEYESQVVSCSYDPNDKAVSPEGYSGGHLTLYSDTLAYTIRFQNTGNDTAFTVVIRDFIDPSLDLSTFHIQGNSHPMTTLIYPNRMAEFRFENIQLPDSIVDEPGSHGYVKYRIRPFQNLSLPKEVSNTADIYFDANVPVRTNAVINTLVVNLPTDLLQSHQMENIFLLIPNPVHHQAELLVSDDFFQENSLFKIVNVFGQEVYAKTFDNKPIRFMRNNLTAGIYLYVITRLDGKRAQGKFVIE